MPAPPPHCWGCGHTGISGSLPFSLGQESLWSGTALVGAVCSRPDLWHCFECVSAKGILEGAGPWESAEARHEVPARSMLVCYGRETPAEASWGEGEEAWMCAGGRADY